MSVLVAGVTRLCVGTLCRVTAAAGKIPRAPATAADPERPGAESAGPLRASGADSGARVPVWCAPVCGAPPLAGYASPARSSASVPARSDARRSSRVKPAGASVRVVTPAAA